MRDYEPDISQILGLYQQLEDDIITSMTKRMLNMGRVSESTKYEAEILQASGLLYEDILALIAQRTDATTQHVRALFEAAGVQTVMTDNKIHQKAGAVPVDIRQDAGMRQILEAGYRKTLGTMKNLVSTTANLVQTAFVSACDRAYMQVSSGAFSYQQAIRQAVKNFGDTGATVQYPSGHRDKLDVAVRRAVLTGVGQTSAMVAMERAKQADCYLMELTAHSGSRPEHAVWQGQLVSLTGKDVGKTIDGLHVFSLEQIGYQTGAGFKGWNCRHNWHPYYVGFSIPNYTKEQLAELDAKNIAYNGKMYSEYEISQMQRTAERKIRALKRQIIASQTALQNAPDAITKSELQADYTQNAVKLKASEKQLREFCKQTGRRNDTFRTQVDGFGRSEAQKAVWAVKKQNNLDYMARFTPKYSDRKKITSGTIQMQVKRVSNSKFNMFTDIDANRKNKAVRLVEKNLFAIQDKLPKGFKMPLIAVVDFNKHNINPYAIGGYDKYTGIMYLNNRYDTKEKVLDFVNQSKGRFANKTEYAPILHELGHKYYEDSIKRLAISQNISYNDVKSKIDRKIYNYIESNGGNFFVEENLSEYAKKGYEKNLFTEVIAECFSVRNDNLIAKEILSLLE